MNDLDIDDDAPDAFTREGECWAWKRPEHVIIGVSSHMHLCRELIDEEGRHEGDHICSKCGQPF